MSDFSYTRNGIVPKLVEDVSLKRARTEDGAIEVTSPEALGKVDDTAWDGTDPEATVISLLKGIVNKLQWFYIEIYDKIGPQSVVPVVTQLTNDLGVGPTQYQLNRPAGTSMSVSDGYMSFAIGQDTDYWYLQATTGPTTIGFTKSTMSFDDYRFRYGSISSAQYMVQLKDSDNNVIMGLSDSSYNPGVACLIIPKTMLHFNLPYS